MDNIISIIALLGVSAIFTFVVFGIVLALLIAQD
jgi:hypothetical protein